MDIITHGGTPSLLHNNKLVLGLQLLSNYLIFRHTLRGLPTAPALAIMFSETYAEVLRDCMTKDPLLPRPNPTTSFWQEPPHPTVSNAQSPTLPQITDLAVIGSGITGCSVTKTLLQQPSLSGKRITVLEARTLCSSATGRNGGHLVSDTPESFSRLVAILGVEEAKKIAKFSFASMDRVKEVVASLSDELKGEAQLREVTSVSGFGDVETFEHFKASLAMFEEALPELKGQNEVVEKAEAQTRFKFRGVVGAELQHKAGALWPYRLITGIFEMLTKEHSSRFSIETSTPVTYISYSDSPSDAEYPYILTTPRGSIRAAKVIHCTNAHASHLLPALSGKIFPLCGTMSTQAKGSVFPNLGSTNSWSYVDKGTLDPKTNVWSWTLYYITQDPNTGDIYIGGEKQELDQLLVSDDTIIGDIPSKALSTILPKIFSEGWEEGDPVVKKIWSGIMGFTADMLPLVGHLTKSMTGRQGDGEWFAGGFNGHGMDKSWLTGESLVDMIVGKDVSAWFPTSYRITEERLAKMDLENILEMFGGAGS